MNKRLENLIEALKECTTDENALAYKDFEIAKRRITYISALAEVALGQEKLASLKDFNHKIK